jgi:outer membrane protein OmpA-like peptidoglycan-associated protein
MRTRLILSALLLSTPAMAQVTIDQRALEPLQPQNAAPASPAKTEPAKPVAPKTAAPKTAAPKPKPAASGTTVRPQPPVVPQNPPPDLTLPPPIVVPTRPVQPAAPAAINADAPGDATPVPGGLRVSFGTGRADLNPTTEGAIRALVRGGANIAAAPDTASFTITTFAPGTPEDPSTPRRLSLSRALTVRSVLISQGVASVRIYVRALGPASLGFADGPPDRADITIATNAVAPVAAKPN